MTSQNKAHCQFKLAEAITSFQASAERLFERITPHLKVLKERGSALGDALARLFDAMPKATRILCARGWYPSIRMPLPMLASVVKAVDMDDIDAVDSVMTVYARSVTKATRQSLCERWPERAQILSDAFDAHREGKYTLSITTMLAQADGIGCEILGIRQFFSQGRARKALRGKLNALRIDGDFFAPLFTHRWIFDVVPQLDFGRSEDGTAEKLRRHAVLHGSQLDYHSEANGLRAIMLLQFLVELDECIMKHRTRCVDEQRFSDEIKREYRQAQSQSEKKARKGTGGERGRTAINPGVA